MLNKIYIQIFIIFMTLLLVGFANNFHNEEELKNEFHSIQKDYFLKLDFCAPNEELKTIPKFSAALSALADKQRTVLAANKNLTKDDKELAGLIFIYDAMLNSNIIIGILEGKLSFSDFTKDKIFSNDRSTQNGALQARAKYIISELKTAANLRPNDHRIDSWIVGAKSLAEKIQTGSISKSTQKAIINTITTRPSFNLWTAILLLHNEDPASNQELLQASRNFVDAANQGKDPCTLHPKDCISTWKAPYNFQAALTELGDVFLQQAEYFLTKGNIEKAMMLAGFAEGTYSQLFKPKHIEETIKWPDYEVLMMRKGRLAEIRNHIIPKDPLRSMSQYQRAYQCASCHGRF